MNKILKIALIVIAALLIGNGLINIVDDGRILTFDITSILSGIGFLLISFLKK
jgi:ABC-type transport system involved in multi-copper enzyme maturation permease subunit